MSVDNQEDRRDFRFGISVFGGDRDTCFLRATMKTFSQFLLAQSLLTLLVSLTIVLSGCGGSPKAPVSKESKTLRVGDLPELGEPMDPLDDGRIVVAPPAGWHIPSRDSKWIVRFKSSPKLRYPTIMLTAEDYEDVFNVSKDNVDEFAEQVSALLEQDGKTARLADEITPVEVKRFVGITYRRRARVKKKIIERVFAETVVAGRKYTLELRALKGTDERFRPYLFAVAGGIQFLQAEAPPTQPPPKKPKPKKPAEDSEYEEEL